MPGAMLSVRFKSGLTDEEVRELMVERSER
jgi:hypothetical protein